LDKIEDAEAAGWIRDLGAGPSINIAVSMIVSAYGMLNGLIYQGADRDNAGGVIEDFHQTIMHMCGAQHRDLTSSTPSLEECWGIAEEKSGRFFSLACRAGASLATRDQSKIGFYSSYGHHLGMMIQIHNDVGGIWARDGKDNDILSRDRWSIPIAYAMEVGSEGEKKQLRQILMGETDSTYAIAAATKLLESVGADLYMDTKLGRHRAMALQSIARAKPEAMYLDIFLRLLDNIKIFRIIPTKDHEQ
jgi:geranylgeranyl pyrophosphate synthase